MLTEGAVYKHTDPVHFVHESDAFRTVESECDDALISFINYIFHEEYDRTARVRHLRNEQYIEREGQADEKHFDDYEADNDRLAEFTEVYAGIIKRLEGIAEADLSLRSKGAIIKQMESVTRRLAEKRENISNKVGDIMGGQVVKMEWLEKYDAAVAEGERRGEAKGEEKRKKLEAEKNKAEAEVIKLKEEIARLRAALA